jgi:hypothetical protein
MVQCPNGHWLQLGDAEGLAAATLSNLKASLDAGTRATPS